MTGGGGVTTPVIAFSFEEDSKLLPGQEFGEDISENCEVLTQFWYTGNNDY